jgi:probable rRNA maturation factor
VTLSLAVQFASKAKHVPTRAQVRRWALAAHAAQVDAVVTIRYVDEREGRALNLAFRQKDYATNVLTFVHDLAPSTWGGGPGRGTRNAAQTSQSNLPHPNPFPQGEGTYAADIVICAPVIAREAREQKKPVAAHHGHMVIHGLLHAQGFDHEAESEATAMEAIEIAVLKRFRIKNPYEID